MKQKNQFLQLGKGYIKLQQDAIYFQILSRELSDQFCSNKSNNDYSLRHCFIFLGKIHLVQNFQRFERFFFNVRDVVTESLYFFGKKNTFYRDFQIFERFFQCLESRGFIVRNVVEAPSQNPTIPRINWGSKGKTTICSQLFCSQQKDFIFCEKIYILYRIFKDLNRCFFQCLESGSFIVRDVVEAPSQNPSVP